MKKSELEKKIKELEEDNEKLLLYNGYITRICLQNIAINIQKQTPEQKEVTDFFFRFNVHGFSAYFTKVFFMDRGLVATIKQDEEWLSKWNEHVEKVLNPMFDKEVTKIHEKYKSKKDNTSYVV